MWLRPFFSPIVIRFYLKFSFHFGIWKSSLMANYKLNYSPVRVYKLTMFFFKFPWILKSEKIKSTNIRSINRLKCTRDQQCVIDQSTLKNKLNLKSMLKNRWSMINVIFKICWNDHRHSVLKKSAAYKFLHPNISKSIHPLYIIVCGFQALFYWIIKVK